MNTYLFMGAIIAFTLGMVMIVRDMMKAFDH